jgi:hypothetical protein
MRLRKEIAVAAVALLMGVAAAFLVFKQGPMPLARRSLESNATGPTSSKAPTRTRSVPPRSSSSVTQASVGGDLDEATPGSPSYRPQKYLVAVELKRIFEHEARDEVWANPVERHLSAAVAKDLAFLLRSDQADVSIECRTTACRLSFPSSIDMTQVQEFMRVVYLSNGSVTDHANRTHFVLYSGGPFDPHGDPDHTISVIKRRRDMNLRAVARRNPTLLTTVKRLRPEDFPPP